MIYYVVFLLLFAYLDVNSPWSSMQWLNMVLNHVRAIRVLCYINEFMLISHIESQPFQGERRVRYLWFTTSSYIV